MASTNVDDIEHLAFEKGEKRQYILHLLSLAEKQNSFHLGAKWFPSGSIT